MPLLSAHSTFPRRSAQASPGGIRAKGKGMQVPLRPSGILSATVVSTVFFGQFQLSIPAQPSGYLASPVMLAKSKGIHLRRTERASLEGAFVVTPRA